MAVGNTVRDAPGFVRMPLLHRSSRRAMAGAAAAAIVLAACGGGDGDTTDVPAADRTATSVAPASDPADSSAALPEAFATATPLDGGTFDAEALVGNDLVVWFWAPWCTICRGEAPEVAEVAARYADQLQVIGVPGRGELDAMQGFVDDTGIGAIRQLADLDGSVWQSFGVYGQPAYAFVDDDGEIELFVGGLGGDALADRIDELLAD